MINNILNIIKKVSLFSLIFVMVLINVQLYPFANQEVSVNISNNPNLDIILTSRNTSFNISNFENDIKNSLKLNGIGIDNIELIKVNRINTNKIDLQNDFTWKTDLNSTIGTITTNSNAITMKGNKTFLGKNCVYTMSTLNSNIYDFKYDYNITFGDSFNSGGMLLKVTENNNTLTGYLLSFNNKNSCKDISKEEAALWKFNWKKGTNTSNILFYDSSGNPKDNEAYLVKTLDINKTGTMNIHVEQNKIILSGGGLYKTEIPIDENYNGNGFGFYSDHYEHDCNSIGSFKLNNIEMSVSTPKQYKDILTEPIWRKDAKHIIINIDNSIDETITGSDSIGEVLSRTLANDIHFIQLGSNTNEEIMTNFINSNDSKGKFINTTNYNIALNSISTYIKSLLTLNSDEQYLLIDQKSNVEVYPESLKFGTISDEFPQGSWYIDHYPTYFENNSGIAFDTGFYTPNLMCSFDKPGLYKIYFNNNLVKEIYAHRTPVADFALQMNGTSLTLLSNAYDLDDTTDYGYGKGIASEKWYYKEVKDKDWLEGKLKSFDKNKTYIIKLEVEDLQGATNYTTKHIGKGIPIANFNYESDEIKKYEPLIINNTSYDPEGNEIIKTDWTLYKNDVKIKTYSEPLTNFNQFSLGPGKYKYSLVVTNSKGTKSNAYSKSFIVKDEQGMPYGNANIEIKDKDGKPLSDTKIEFYDKNGNLVDTGYTDNNGKLTKPLLEGNYTVKAKNIPNGYSVPQEQHINIIKYKETDIGFIPDKIIHHYDVNILIKDNKGKILPNCKVEIQDEKGNKIKDIETDISGKIKETLPEGNYIFKTKKIPGEYYLPKPQSINLNKNTNIDFIPVNIAHYGDVTIKIVDKDFKLISGCKIEVYDENNVLIDTLLTGKDGLANPQLGVGKYTFKVVEVPNGYSIPETQIAEITKNSNTSLNFKLENTKPNVRVKVTVKDNFDEIIKDAKIDVFDEKGNLMGTVPTDNTILEMPPGNYTFKPSGLPSEYEPSEGKTQPIENPENEVELIVKKYTGTGKIKITAKNNNKPVENAEVTIYNDEGKPVANGKTDSNGEFNKELPPGDYFVLLSDGNGHAEAKNAQSKPNETTNVPFETKPQNNNGNGNGQTEIVQTGDIFNFTSIILIGIISILSLFVLIKNNKKD